MRQRGFTLIELLIVVAIIGIIAAIAIPALLRARVSANEAAVQGDLRVVLSSAAAYESSSQTNGYPASITCLSTPSDGACIPGYPATAPTFVDASLATATGTGLPKAGYVRSWVPGAVSIGVGRTSFCYQTVPSRPNQTGIRSFGGDSSGVIAGTYAQPADCCAASGVLDTGVCSAVK